MRKVTKKWKVIKSGKSSKVEVINTGNSSKVGSEEKVGGHQKWKVKKKWEVIQSGKSRKRAGSQVKW